jgi:hypothetical protein
MRTWLPYWTASFALLLVAVHAACDVEYQTESGQVQELALGSGTETLCILQGAQVVAKAGPGVVFRYGHVHVAGTLRFEHSDSSAELEFRAESILVENHGVVIAGRYSVFCAFVVRGRCWIYNTVTWKKKNNKVCAILISTFVFVRDSRRKRKRSVRHQGLSGQASLRDLR